jgi:hypothetical protein
MRACQKKGDVTCKPQLAGRKLMAKIRLDGFVVVMISFIDAVHFVPLFLWSVFIVHGTIQWGGPKKLGASLGQNLEGYAAVAKVFVPMGSNLKFG